MSHVMYVTGQNFESAVLQSDVAVLVDFYADWCGPCKAISPMLEELADESGGDFRVAKVDIDANGETAETYEVQSIPTLILFVNGIAVERWIGMVPKGQILSEVRTHVSRLNSMSEN